MTVVSRRSLIHGLTGALASPLLLTRAEAEVTADMMKYRPEIEPLVSLIERTPRERCAEMAVEQLKRGVSYRQLMAATFLAGLRNVNPRPPGFALHCVFVIHSAHLMSLEAPADARLLPLFYAIDNFKSAQDRDARQPAGDYTMRPIQGTLPSPERAAAELTAAMEAWDMERAERAVVSVARNRTPAEAFEMLFKYGARDYRNIGHKAIYAANAWRTLHTIGWQYAEPVLRSLVLAQLDFARDQKVNGYALDDQCYAANLKRVKEILPRLPNGWTSDEANPSVTRSILTAIRESTPEEACADAANRLVKGTATAKAVWDAVHLAAAELRLRANKGAALASIHAVTSANGLHHSYLAASDVQNRLLILLQGVGWMGQFRTSSQAREDNLRPYIVTNLEPAEENLPLDRALEETFAAIPSKPDVSAARVFRLAQDLTSRQAFITAALRQTLTKAEEVHYYKYLAALIEDIPLASAEWQPHLTATLAYYIKGAADAEPASIKRAREAIKSLTV